MSGLLVVEPGHDGLLLGREPAIDPAPYRPARRSGRPGSTALGGLDCRQRDGVDDVVDQGTA